MASPNGRVTVEDLVRWLALPYGDNEPIFATELPDGSPLFDGTDMQVLYRSIVGTKEGARGRWVRCGECGLWAVHSELIEPAALSTT